MKRGFAAVARLRKRAEAQLGGDTSVSFGGQERVPLPDTGRAPDALTACAALWLEALSVRRLAGRTLEDRRYCLRVFIAWAAERDVRRAAEVTRPILEAYQRWVSRYEAAPRQGRNAGQPRRLAWSTQRERIRSLKEFFRWLTRQNLLLHNPASELELPRSERRLPVAALTASELTRLLAVPDLNDPLGVRDRAILELFYATGLRRTELCHLELSDRSAEHGTLTVRRGKGGKDRVVPVGARAAYWCDKYEGEVRPRLCLDGRERALFLTGYGGPFNPDVLSYMVSRWMEVAGLAGRGSCHLLRHTCATHMLEGGADIRYIQQLLGHENLETTAIYTEVTIRQLIEVHARCHPSGRLENAASVATEVPA